MPDPDRGRRERPELSVVIPAFNEAARLGKTLQAVTAWLRSRGETFEVVVVDDGSGDGTAAVADSFQAQGVRTLRHSLNRGKGAAVRTGVRSSSGSRVLISDSDLSTPIEELARLEPRLAEAPIVIGSRAKDSASIRRAQSRLRTFLGRAFNLVVRSTMIADVADTQCGFKLLEGSLARKLFGRMVTDGFAFDVELLWLARRAGYGIVEVGVTWWDDRASKVRPWRDGPAMLREILRFRLHHWRVARGRSNEAEPAQAGKKS